MATPCAAVWQISNLRPLRLGEEKKKELECGSMPNVMVALSNIDGALCSTPQSLADSTRAPCSNEAKARKALKFDWCPKLTKRSLPLVGRSSSYCADRWRRYRCLTSFLPIIDKCLSCEDSARQSCAMVRRWRLFASFLRPVFPISSEPRAAYYIHAF